MYVCIAATTHRVWSISANVLLAVINGVPRCLAAGYTRSPVYITRSASPYVLSRLLQLRVAARGETGRALMDNTVYPSGTTNTMLGCTIIEKAIRSVLAQLAELFI